MNRILVNDIVLGKVSRSINMTHSVPWYCKVFISFIKMVRKFIRNSIKKFIRNSKRKLVNNSIRNTLGNSIRNYLRNL